MNANETIVAAVNPNKSLSQVELLEKMRAEFPDLHERAEVVGKWVWVEFQDVPDIEARQYLKDVGFFYNRRRKAWQHTCGTGRRRRAPYDPRQKYGVVKVGREDEE